MRVFITGITGTLGTAIARYLHSKGDEVFGCGRSESKLAAWNMAHDGVGKALLGDCLNLAVENSSIYQRVMTCAKVYHCAALKHVDLCESQPQEAYRQNIGGIDVVSYVCHRYGIPLVFISTDKACLPQGVYGATKLIGEAIALSRDAAVVRFGNLIGSSGSVFQKWVEATSRGEPIQITDPEMTRYFIMVKEAARFAAESSVQGKVRIPVMKSVQLGELAREMKALVEVVGRRPGETQHQWLVALGELASVDYHTNVITLGVGSTENRRLSSEDARRWDYRELIDIAMGAIQ